MTSKAAITHCVAVVVS